MRNGHSIIRRGFAVGMLLLAASCGGDDGGYDTEPAKPAPRNPPGGNPGGGEEPLQGEALVAAECGRCHAKGQSPAIKSIQDLKKVSAKRVIDSGRMPPDRALSVEAKAGLLKLL